MKPRKFAIIALLLSLSVLGLYGCGAETPTPTPIPPTNTPEPPTATLEPPTPTTAAESTTGGGTGTTGGGGLSNDAIALLDQAQKATAAVKSYHFKLTTDTGQGIVTTAEGDFEKPNNMRLVQDLGGQGTTEMIIVDNETFFKQPGTDTYMSLGASEGLLGAMTTFVDPENITSFGDIATSASIEGEEELDGVSTTRVKFEYDLAKAEAAMAEQMGQPSTPTGAQGNASGEMWVEKGTNYIRQMTIMTAGDLGTGVTGGTSTVTITYSNFDEPVNPPIEKPANVQDLPSGLPGMSLTPTP